MRIDSHHSFTERYPLEHLETILHRNRFDGSVLVVARASLPVLSFPAFVRGLVVTLNPQDPQLPYLLDQYQRDARFRGICHQFSGEMPEGLGELERRGLSLDALADPGLVSRIAERYPSLRIVIDHLGRGADPTGGDQWARDLEGAASCPQVFCKLSAIARLEPSSRRYVQHALAVLGPRRLMFGSDWPAGLPDVTWKASLAAFTQAIGAQNIEVREELLGGTAERFYAL